MTLLLLTAAIAALALFGPPGTTEIATIDGQSISTADLDAYFAVRGVPRNVSADVRKRAVEDVIDRVLVSRFLERNKVQADAEQLEVALRAAREGLAADGTNAEAIFASRGLDEARVRSELGLTIAWRTLVNRALTEQQIREHFEANRRRFDGTRLRVAQIIVPYERGESAGRADRTTARAEAIRAEMSSGKMSFSEAARTHSKSPTASGGGVVGWIRPAGDLPQFVTKAAYDLAPNEVSQVVLTATGAHLVTVLEVEAGELSLEDARPAIVDELAKAMWRARVAAERKAAKIVLAPGP